MHVQAFSVTELRQMLVRAMELSVQTLRLARALVVSVCVAMRYGVFVCSGALHRARCCRAMQVNVQNRAQIRGGEGGGFWWCLVHCLQPVAACSRWAARVAAPPDSSH